MTSYLFVYGTLRPGYAPAEIAATVALLRPVGRGSVRARLYQFADYPGAVLDAAAEPLAGEIFALPAECEGALARLDAYEDFRPGAPAESLFLRVETPVAREDGSKLLCWVYVYNRAVS
jgi:gamma-glutamylcyclotransferase (GGCT)/AIG2-like uncharacterized protein YtfP